MADLGLIEAIRQAQGWCPCGGSGMVMEFGPTDCSNIDAHKELDALMRHLVERTTSDSGAS